MADAPIPQQLLDAREKIDEIDRRMIELLADRFTLTEEVGQLKASNDLTAVDPKRESEKLQILQSLAQELGISPKLVSSIFSEIMAEVVANHNRIREARNGS